MALTLAIGAASCREADAPLGGGDGRVFVTSDPVGGHIFVDNRDTGRLTPDTLTGIGGTHDITVQLDTFQAVYGYAARILVPSADSVFTLTGPLVNRCGDPLCFGTQFRHYSANRVRFASNPVGTLFLERGSSGNGLLWPSVTNNSYVSGSMVGFSGIVGSDTVALGIYDNAYLAGRPAPLIEQTAENVDLEQVTWILPASGSINRPTVRGIQVTEQVNASTDVEDVVLLRLTFTNITDEPLYAAIDPTVPVSGYTYYEVFIGFLLDPDIGSPGDDALSYEPDLNLAFAYDSRFNEPEFSGDFTRAPGLIGLKVLDAPAGARVVLNGWNSLGSTSDWYAGQVSEKTGWLMLSGVRPYQPDHPFLSIGHLPTQPGDVRLSVSAGPLRLEPGDSAAVTVAVILAEPVPDTYTTGVAIEPGDPTDATRQLYAVAGNLFGRAREMDAAPAFAARPARRR